MMTRLPRTHSLITVALTGACIFLLCLMAGYGTAHAVSPSPELIEKLKAEGRLAEYMRLRRDAADRGICAPSQTHRETRPWAAGVTANYNVLCILVDFSDRPSTGGQIASTPAQFDSLLFSTSPANPTGSFKDYYSEVSYGQMNVVGTVVGWYRLSGTLASYMAGTSGIGTYPNNAQALVEAAIDAAEADGVDFSIYDNNNDGFVDAVMIIVPGQGAEETGDGGDSHSHKFAVQTPRLYDSVWVSEYTIQPEETGVGVPGLNAVGVFCHEWGHVLGLPDLYDLDNCDSLPDCGWKLSWGLGDWSLMALGNWLGNSRTPAHPDAWCRIKMGFLTATNITSNMTSVTVPAIETTPKIYRLWSNGLIGSEYFLVENRRRTGFDTNLPSQGLIIYHVDDLTADNRNQWIEGSSPPSPHYKIAVEQADGIFALERWFNQGDAGDVYSNDSAGFDQLSYPSSKAYSSTATQVAVWNISPAASSMLVNFDVNFSRPFLQTSNHVIADPAGDNDGVPEPGETFQITFDLSNLMLSANNVNVVVTAPGSNLVFIDNSFAAGTVGTQATVNNNSDPITITVPANYRSRVEDFILTITADGGASQWVETLPLAIGPPHFLVVDDDRGENLEGRLLATLDSLSEIYRHWNVDSLGIPSADTLLDYPTVFWMTGDTNSVSPTAAGVSVMQTFLDSNGHLFLTGQDIAENIAARADSSFLRDYFGIRYVADEGLIVVLDGVGGDTLGDGLRLAALGSDGAGNQMSSDRIALSPGSTATIAYTYFSSGDGAAAYVGNGYRAVFFGFGFEAISSIQGGFDTRVDALQPIIVWLDGDLATGVFDDTGDESASARLPRAFELAQNYPNPFNAGTVIPFTLNGPGASHVNVEVFDILGRRVETLLDEVLEPGIHQVEWNGTDRNGQRAASGIYLYRLSVNGHPATARRMVLLK